MTGRISTEASRIKADRALKLYEQGIRPIVIAERLGVRPQHVHGMVAAARARRDKAKEAAT